MVGGGVDAQNQIARADGVAHSFHPLAWGQIRPGPASGKDRLPSTADVPDTRPSPRCAASWESILRRRTWLTRGVERCVWNEYDREDEAEELAAESLLGDLHERLAELMADPETFLQLDPDTLLVELCKELGLTPPEFDPPAPQFPAAPAAVAGNGQDSS
jgi:hypothetical protein